MTLTRFFYARTATGNFETVSIDLGQTHNIADVKVGHYYRDWRSYAQTKTEISTNGTTWTALYNAGNNTVFNDGVYKETPLGRSYGPNTGRPTGAKTITYTSGEKPNTITSNGLSASFNSNHAGERTLMQMNYSGSYPHTLHYLGGNYEREVRNTTVTERLYLGSICAVSNSNGTIYYDKHSYDAWGHLRKPTTLQPYGPGEQPQLFLNRGYTGHEHLPEFGLINMNARLYDPIIGRFISPDPYVQAPDFSQSYNRYTYCLNNPLIYIDENGEWFFRALTLFKSCFKLFYTNNATVVQEVLPEYQRAYQIDHAWQGSDREMMDFAGYMYSGFLNLGGNVNSVTHYGGAMAIERSNNFNNGSGITLGAFIIGNPGLQADPNNALFQHEYGHYLQYKEMGSRRYFREVGSPSLLSAWLSSKVPSWNHRSKPFEMDANQRSYADLFNRIGDDLNWDSGYPIDADWLDNFHNPVQSVSMTNSARNRNMGGAMYNPTTISPYFNWAVQGGFIYQEIEHDFWKYKRGYNRQSSNRLSVLLSLK